MWPVALTLIQRAGRLRSRSAQARRPRRVSRSGNRARPEQGKVGAHQRSRQIDRDTRYAMTIGEMRLPGRTKAFQRSARGSATLLRKPARHDLPSLPLGGFIPDKRHLQLTARDQQLVYD